MIIILFGLAASGKTYIGDVIGKNFRFHHEDADQWLTKEMQQYIVEEKLFTLSMLDEFSKDIARNIELLSKIYPKLVISQALYFQKNRNMIKEYLETKLPEKEVLFLQIEADNDVIYKRLEQRGDWVSPDYASSMQQFFEPMHEAIILQNNQEGVENIIAQIKKIDKISSKIN